jgi:hypothetical protein
MTEVDCWCALASRLGFIVVAPATVAIGDESVTFTALLPQFGGGHALIADPDRKRIGRHAQALSELGYGYSAVELGCDSDDTAHKTCCATGVGRRRSRSLAGGR